MILLETPEKKVDLVKLFNHYPAIIISWTASSEFGTYRLCEQRRFRRACASAQSRQNLRCSLIQAVNQEEPSDRKPDPWPFWMAGHAQLKFVMTECSKTQIRLTGLSLIKCQFVMFCVDGHIIMLSLTILSIAKAVHRGNPGLPLPTLLAKKCSCCVSYCLVEVGDHGVQISIFIYPSSKRCKSTTYSSLESAYHC